ncbi:unnamed protein product [Cuscuta campestris]|uniref:Uncharacterized protein n=1 Tax=Cuscuta campestris TaxID=132261 RepID=A0A484N2Z8_9ASTE|nr:unnamed protein product [Cuscuta campestris]
MEEVEPTFNSAIHPFWEDIERAESYLVCCMYDEAASCSHSVLKSLLEIINSNNNNIHNHEIAECNDELVDMLESAGMAFVQSLNQLGRISEILKELKMLFGSVTAIPAHVFYTGACLQIPGFISSDFQDILEEYLSKWEYMDGNYYASGRLGVDITHVKGFNKQIVLGVDEYLEVVDLYVINILGRVMKNVDLAVSWVEKASLPSEKQQILLRLLHSMNTSDLDSSSQPTASLLLQIHEYPNQSDSMKEENPSSANDLENNTKETIMKMYKNRAPFWLFRTITLKFGNAQFVISNGNIFLCCLPLIFFYMMRRKPDLKSTFRKHAWYVKKALTDLLELAFSYQVNPLAGVQSLPLAAALGTN